MKTLVAISGMPTAIKSFMNPEFKIISMNWKHALEKNHDAVPRRRSAGLYSAVGVSPSGWVSLQNVLPACKRQRAPQVESNLMSLYHESDNHHQEIYTSLCSNPVPSSDTVPAPGHLQERRRAVN